MIASGSVPRNRRSSLSRCVPGDMRTGHTPMKKLAVLSLASTVLLSALPLAGCYKRGTISCDTESLTPARANAVEAGVQAFARAVAHDVTEEGPLAWRRYFEAGPEFFMAVNGQMAFPNGSAADKGTQNVALTIKKIELKWGDDLRVDPLTPELAVVAAPWHEIQVDAAGHRTEEAGFFTGLAEYRDGRWQFRDAHWSAVLCPSPVH
jgi:hypothetical protein